MRNAIFTTIAVVGAAVYFSAMLIYVSVALVVHFIGLRIFILRRWWDEN